MASTTRDLTQGPVWRALLSVSGPMAFGIGATIFVGLVDAYFLGRIGTDPLAAVGFVFPVTMTIASLSIGLSAGANAAISQAIGRKDDDDAVVRIGLHALILGCGLAAAVMVAVWAFDRPLLSLMGASGGVLDAALRYTPIWAASFPFLVAMMLVNSIFRAHGNGGRSAMVMVASALLNVGATPAFILGLGPLPEMGIAGAAAGTLFSYVVASALAGWLAWRAGILRTCGRPLAGLGRSARQVGAIGGPAAISNAIRPAGMAAVTAAVATLGAAYVAGFGAAGRVQGLASVPLLALSAGIGPVVGQAWGAGQAERAAAALRQSCLFAVAYGLSLALVLFLFAEPIAALFGADGTSTAAAAQYLRIVGWSLFGFGILIAGNAALNAIDRAGYALGLSALRVLAVYLPLAWLGAAVLGYAGILIAAVIANVFAALAVLVAAHAAGLPLIDAAPVRWLARRLPRSRTGMAPAE